VNHGEISATRSCCAAAGKVDCPSKPEGGRVNIQVAYSLYFELGVEKREYPIRIAPMFKTREGSTDENGGSSTSTGWSRLASGNKRLRQILPAFLESFMAK